MERAGVRATMAGLAARVPVERRSTLLRDHRRVHRTRTMRTQERTRTVRLAHARQATRVGGAAARGEEALVARPAVLSQAIY